MDLSRARRDGAAAAVRHKIEACLIPGRTGCVWEPQTVQRGVLMMPVAEAGRVWVAGSRSGWPKAPKHGGDGPGGT
jgi:hypothetical protein